MDNKFIKSPLNYTGGKYRLLPQITDLFPKEQVDVFYDLFTGGGNVAVNFDNANKIISNDICKPIIELFNTFKRSPIDTILSHIENTIETFGLSIDNSDAYNWFRKEYNESVSEGVYCQLDLFILICYSFNHQIRFNRNGFFNMPFGKNKSQFNKNIKNNLIDFVNKIQSLNIEFSCQDFLGFDLKMFNKNDFVYCDPPYLITCASYNEQNGWNREKEIKLLNFLDALNENNIKFALSNVLTNKGNTNDLLFKWSDKYNVNHLSNTYSNCSYHAKNRDKTSTDEVLITNY